MIAKHGGPRLVELLTAAGLLASGEAGIIARLPGQIAESLVRLGPLPLTVVHGDLRLDNLLFDHDGNVVVIDWQGLGSAPPSWDLAYFLTQSLDAETRRSHQDALLDRYVDAMRTHDISATRDELLGGYGDSLWFGLVVACSIGLVGDPTDPRTKLLATTMGRRALDALADGGLTG